MIRGAAKNYNSTTIVIDTQDYNEVINQTAKIRRNNFWGILEKN